MMKHRLRFAMLAALPLATLAVAAPHVVEAVGDGGCVEHANQTAGIAAFDEVDYIAELDAGADTAHYANWLLEQVGVNRDARADRHIYTYCDAIVGLWLRLDPSEAAAMDELTRQRPEGVKGGELSFQVSAPVVQDSVTPADYSLQSPQHIPPSRERIQWRAPSSNGTYNYAPVAVLDTGVDAFHSDLNVTNGFDCTMDYPDRWQHDPHGHGTHVSGTIAALNNHFGVAGVAAGAPIISIPVLGSEGYGTMASVLCGVDQALKLGARVANLSLGGTREPESCGGGSPYVNGFCNAVAQNLVVVVAAGNSADDAWSHSPANIDGVVTVGATSSDGPPLPGCSINTPADSFATFSSYGPYVDVVAPSGVCEYSAIPGNRYAWSSGTSMASPAVAGVIAVFIATRPKECSDSPGKAWRAVESYSQEWMDAEGQYGGWLGPQEDQPPTIRFGAPCKGPR